MADRRVESVNQKLRNLASQQGVPVLRVRQQYVFARILARLAEDPAWVLKGGFALELRLGLRARATKDLDLLLIDEDVHSAVELQEILQGVLERELGDDGFTFDVHRPRPHRAEDAEPSTWRILLDARLHGARFQEIPLDVVAVAESGEVATLGVRDPLFGVDLNVPAISIERHAAEKIHAISRLYALARPSSRVKDLVDLLLLDAAGLLQSDSLPSAVQELFLERDGARPPQSLPAPPRAWTEPFRELAEQTALTFTELAVAADRLDEIYRRLSPESRSNTLKENE